MLIFVIVMLFVVGRSKSKLGQTLRALTAYPVHEMIDADVANDHELIAELQVMIANKEMPPTYYEHPAAMEHGATEKILPLAFLLHSSCILAAFSQHSSCILGAV